ncbi:MAG: hypothetical protein QG632_734 [Candidatus Dependentiae bacterium]|jgi:hypothetical protein|nr:hypothetical protein [Candidatus Dependentiae bacterium]
MKFKNTPNTFLKLGGVLLFILGIVGLSGLTQTKWEMSTIDSYLRLSLGLFMFIGGLTLSAKSQRTWTLVIGGATIVLIAAMAVSHYIAQTPDFIEDMTLHIVLACWALSAGARRSTSNALTPANEKV